MKKAFLLALLVVGCGGAVEGVDDAASAEWRCLPHTSAGASLPCDEGADAGATITCDCPSSCSYEGLAGSCTTR